MCARSGNAESRNHGHLGDRVHLPAKADIPIYRDLVSSVAISSLNNSKFIDLGQCKSRKSKRSLFRH